VPDVKFTISGEAGSLLRTNEQIKRSQDEVARGFSKTAGAAEEASSRTAAAVAKSAEAYELAEQGTTAGRPSVRFGYTARRAAVRTYGVAPEIKPPPQSFVARSADVMPLALTGEITDGAPHARWAQTQDAIDRVSRAVHAERLGKASAEGQRLVADFERTSPLNPVNIARRASEQHGYNAVTAAASGVGAEVHAERLAKAEAEGQRLLAEFERTSPLNPDNIAKRADRRKMIAGKIGQAATVAAAAGAAAFAYGQEVLQNYDALGTAGVTFEHEMTGLIGIGDNAKRIPRLKEKVLALSTGKGFDRATVANTMYDLESAASNLPAATRNDLLQQAMLVTKVKGGDLNTNTTALTKTFQNYGSDFGSVAKMTDAISFVEEKASVNFGDLATLLPDVLPAAKELGATFSEVGAGLEVVTQRAGKNESAFTGFRNTILRLNKTEEEGIHLTGSLADRFGQLHDRLATMDSISRTQLLEKIFGEKTITYASILLNNVDQMRQARAELDHPPEGKLQQTLTDRYKDPAFAGTQMIESVDQLSANIPAMKAQDPAKLRRVIIEKLTRAGAEYNNSPNLPKILKDASALVELAGGDLSTNEDAKTALSLLLDSQVQAAASAPTDDGRKAALFQHDYLSLMLGEATGKTVRKLMPKSYQDAHLPKEGEYFKFKGEGVMRDVPTGPADAERFRRWVSRGANLTGDRFLGAMQGMIDQPKIVPGMVARGASGDEALRAKGYSFTDADFLDYLDAPESSLAGWKLGHRSVPRRAYDLGYGTPVSEMGRLDSLSTMFRTSSDEEFDTSGVGSVADLFTHPIAQLSAVARKLNNAAGNLARHTRRRDGSSPQIEN
jgi:TP901 family phage tail tape measure protein